MKRKHAEHDAIPNMEGVEWTDEHKKAWELYLAGENVALMGPGGTGKSTFVRAVLYREQTLLDPAVISLSHVLLAGASGIAAVNIEGTTLHHAFGVYDSNAAAEDICRRMQPHTREKIEKARLLILDEVSMSDCHLIDKVDQIARMIRRSERAFGGLRVLMIGDPLQLPPVIKIRGKPWEQNVEPYMMYNADAWRKAYMHIVVLTKVFRQNDPAFVNTLLAIREGVWSAGGKRLIAECTKPYAERGVDAPEIITHLYPHKKTAAAQNEKALKKLHGKAKLYHTRYTGSPAKQKIFRKGVRSPEILELKVGARVMLTRNIDVKGGMANGVQGVVTAMDDASVMVNFDGKAGLKRVIPARWTLRDADGEASAIQIPLVLAYAFTIHGVQGLTLEWLVVHLDGVWDLAQVYVALSRVRCKEHLLVVCSKPDRLTSLYPPRQVVAFLNNAAMNVDDAQKRLKGVD